MRNRSTAPTCPLAPARRGLHATRRKGPTEGRRDNQLATDPEARATHAACAPGRQRRSSQQPGRGRLGLQGPRFPRKRGSEPASARGSAAPHVVASGRTGLLETFAPAPRALGLLDQRRRQGATRGVLCLGTARAPTAGGERSREPAARARGGRRAGCAARQGLGSRGAGASTPPRVAP